MARGPRGGGGTFLGVCLPYFSFLWSLWCSFFFFCSFPYLLFAFVLLCLSAPVSICFVPFLSFCAFLLIFVTIFCLAPCHRPYFSLFPGHFSALSYTCRYLPCQERNLALFLKLPRGPPGFCQLEVARRRPSPRLPSLGVVPSGAAAPRGVGPAWN